MLRVGEAGDLERRRIQDADAERVGTQVDVLDGELHGLRHFAGVKDEAERFRALLEVAAVVYREVALHPQPLAEILHDPTLQTGNELEPVTSLSAHHIDDDLTRVARGDHGMLDARSDESPAGLVAVGIRLVVDDYPRQKVSFAVLGHYVELDAVTPEHVRPNVECAHDCAQPGISVGKHRGRH